MTHFMKLVIILHELKLNVGELIRLQGILALWFQGILASGKNVLGLDSLVTYIFAVLYV